MGFPLFKFTLNNSIEGSLEIHEPEGWDNGTLKLERNEEYHSLVEYYDQSLIFDDANSYNAVTQEPITGGLSYIRDVEQTQGIDAQITLIIEISEDEGDSYETIFEGIIDIATIKETDFYKLECGVKRNDFWSKFINRKSIPVDLSGIIDMDGNIRSAIASETIPLTPQKLRVRDSFSVAPASDFLTQDFPPPPSYNFTTTNDLGQFDLNIKDINEIEINYNYPLEATTQVFEKIKAKYGGSYRFVISVFCAEASFYIAGSTGGDLSDVDLYIQVNDDTPIAANRTVIPGNTPLPVTPSEITLFEMDETLTLLEGDLVTIYWEYTGGSSQLMGVVYDGSTYYDTIQTPFLTQSTYNVYADTIYQETSSQGFLIKDAAESILSKLVGADDVLNSDYMTTGCAELFAVFKGLNIRGYSLTDKPFAMSFDQWWNGANPIFNLGLGYERGGSPETDKIRIEQKSYFYDPTPSINLDYVNNIERSYALDYIFKAIEIGYNKWSAESESGVDDPQSKRTYRTRFATVGKDEKVLSQFIAASLAIEQTRRNRIEQGKDWRLDEDIIIIALQQGSPGYTPAFDEDFDSITGLLNSDARYNIGISVARNFQRWLDFFSGCLQVPAGEEFKFASGEGNYDMTTLLSGDACEANSPEATVNEKGNFDIVTPLFIPLVYDFEHPLSFEEYKTIRDNPTQAIGVSRGNSGHSVCFIWNLDYKPTRGLGTFTVMLTGLTLGSFEPITGNLVFTGFEATITINADLLPGTGDALFTGFESTVIVDV